MSRKGSGKSKKGSAKSPKVQIKELTEQNAQLNEELIALKNKHEELRAKMSCTVCKILEGVSRKEFMIKDNSDPLDVRTDTLLSMVGQMIVKKQVNDISVEARVEELERRVTQMSMDIACMTKKTMAYENGLQDLLDCRMLEEVKDKVFHLQLIAGQEYHTFAAAEVEPPSEVSSFNETSDVNHNTESVSNKSRGNAVKFNLIPPLKKLPGDTHIKNMHRDLRLYLLKELSLRKASGSDWRMLAERVDIPMETIEYWVSLRLACPAGRVFAEWGEHPSATVRLLQRHLASPQMRCTLLAKWVSDFYEVD